MALSGTLADIGIVELVQFPSNGRKTGELIIAGIDDEARLYYADGALVHVVVGDESGMEGLVEVVSWTTGEFEFRMGVENDSRTIELDLHRVLMLALKTRDERAEAERKQGGKDPDSPVDALPPKAIDILTEIVGANDAISGAYVISDNGTILAQGSDDFDIEAEDLQVLLNQLAGLYGNYNRANLGKVFLDDEEGILHGARLASSHIAVLSAKKGASMGVVSMLMNKLVSGMLEIR
jgi:hypothetical protein